MTDVKEMRGDKLQARREELDGELRVRSDPRTGATWEGDGAEQGRGESPWAKQERRTKMAELQAEGHCFIFVEGEEGTDSGDVIVHREGRSGSAQ
ncbi:UNVERIFIED_CONTAM: hypothetical protein FKN15_073734 [Acipenser sinensis]